MTPKILIRAAEHIGKVWKTDLRDIVTTGQELVIMRGHFSKEDWERLIGDGQWANDGLLPFPAQYALRLVKVAEEARALTDEAIQIEHPEAKVSA